MKQVEKVWAELSAKAQEVELSEAQKVELSTATEIKALVKKVEGYVDNSDEIFKEYSSLVDDYNSVRKRLISLSEKAKKLDGDMFSEGAKLYSAEQSMIKAAGSLGVDASMVKEILRDLNIDVEGLLRLASKEGEKMRDVARVARTLIKIG